MSGRLAHVHNRNTRVDHDGGIPASGLRRIRRAPSSRGTPLIVEDGEFHPPPLQHASTLPISGTSSRSASRSASTAQFFVSGPASPVTEDLQRFPSESLHSFSFARQSEDFLHSRHAIIQKSMEFVRDHKTLKRNAGIANAEAKLSGDAQMQGVMDLLKRAKVVPSLDVNAANTQTGLGLGPLTGPAHMHRGNIFDRSFALGADEEDEDPEPDGQPLETWKSPPNEDAIVDDRKKVDEESRPQSPRSPRRSGLKRTYTDIGLLSLQQKLLETLAQPYTTDDTAPAHNDHAVSFLPGADEAATTSASKFGHVASSKWTPPAQAFFRTDADTPWTIVAANDLACLAFGVTRAEVRSLSILGLIQPDRRQWLEDKLRPPEPVQDPPRSPEVTSSSNGRLSAIGSKGGITARLLSKAPSRTVKTQKAQTDDGSGGLNRPTPVKNHIPRKSRGVLLCGEILPIQKRDGTIGAASFWVMEKRGGLIWIIEQVIEDVAYLEYDSARRLVKSRGDDENIWGEALRSGVKLRYLIPKVSFEDMDNPVFDGEPVLGYYTASTMGGVNTPTCVAKSKGKNELRISSLPNIAGAMVIRPDSLNIRSSNAIFSQALFGHSQPNGMFINDLIPNFSHVLDILAEEDEGFLVEGLVIPEHSFRRARALLALRDGAENAVSLFLRPSGLLARHRDGSDILIDVQMRVVRSETALAATFDDVIVEEGTEKPSPKPVALSEMVYALWITYSRQLHSAGMGVARPEHPLMSRPTTPPPQPPPGDSIPSPPPSTGSKRHMDIPASVPASRDLSPAEPLEHPPPHVPPTPHDKKKIGDFVILEDMGSGAYGEVKLARYRTSRNSKVVIKYVTKKKILVDTWIRDRRLGTTPLEIHVLDFLRRDGYKHPNIVEMVDFFEDDINYYIEMLPHGLPGMDLFDYIELRVGMQEIECRHIFRQVVDAIHHLHIKAQIVHRDVKDENVVLDGENRVKLIDFGSAAYIRNGPFDVFVGTIDYAAPEVLQGRAYAGPEQDVWALGILLYTIVFKENPFYNIDEILDHPLRLPPLEDPYSDDCIDLIQNMLNRDVEARLNIEEVKEHPWLMVED